MLGHLLNDLVRNGRDIRTGQSAIGNMDRVADRRADDLGLDLGETGEHGGDRFDQLNAGLRNIVQTAKEGASALTVSAALAAAAAIVGTFTHGNISFIIVVASKVLRC